RCRQGTAQHCLDVFDLDLGLALAHCGSDIDNIDDATFEVGAARIGSVRAIVCTLRVERSLLDAWACGGLRVHTRSQVRPHGESLLYVLRGDVLVIAGRMPAVKRAKRASFEGSILVVRRSRLGRSLF